MIGAGVATARGCRGTVPIIKGSWFSTVFESIASDWTFTCKKHIPGIGALILPIVNFSTKKGGQLDSSLNLKERATILQYSNHLQIGKNRLREFE